MEINVSLLREKFVIEEVQPGSKDTLLKIVAPSNRLPVHMQSGEENPEDFVVRANNMQNCIRFVAHMISEYHNKGPLYHRLREQDWHVLWDETLNPYERKYSPMRWVAVYYKGQLVYHHGEHHPFFDVIEKCDVVNKGTYEQSVALAQDAFGKAGRNVKINYDSNVGLVADITGNSGRCGMVLRAPKSTMTFNFYMSSPSKDIKIGLALSAAAAFLEGAQLCYIIGAAQARLEMNFIKQYSPEYMQMREALRQIQCIEAEVSVLENTYIMRYRPEKPIFKRMIKQAEDTTIKMLNEM